MRQQAMMEGILGSDPPRELFVLRELLPAIMAVQGPNRVAPTPVADAQPLVALPNGRRTFRGRAPNRRRSVSK